ncbi:MAG: lipid-A-disaccharide synthase [Myxococcales bacterium]|nr:lipid-A-disaccharide synthase [Myxococcales bacterium]
MLENLAGLDRYLFCSINEGWSRPPLDLFFGLFTNLGQGWLITLLGLAGLYLFDRKNFPKNFLVIAAVMLLGNWFVHLIKSWVARPRPLHDPGLGAIEAEAVKTQVLGWLPRWTIPLQPLDPRVIAGRFAELHIVGPKYGWRSYPSGHAAAAFGAAAALIYVYRRWWSWLLLVPAALVGLSRIYVGVHFPLDVLVGGAIGAVNSVVLLAWWRPYTGLGLRRPARRRPSVSPPGQPLVMLVAGEASADAYAANLIAAVRRLRPGARFVGVGGERTIAAGLRPIGKAEEIAIVGFTGVLTGLFALRRIYLGLLRVMDADRPDLLVCLDLPDFNLALANQAKGRGIPVLYYISPQVWAWRTGRIATIADRIDHLVPALPFEKDLYERRHVPVSYFGHPLLEINRPQYASREEARQAFGLALDRPVAVLAPGSRKNEIKYLAPVLAETARLLAAREPRLQFAVPLAPTVDEGWVRGIFAAAGVEITYTRGDFNDLLAGADLGVITSGTATLEAALAGLPHVIVYRGHPLNYAIARRVVQVDKIGLANIILGRTAFRELIQDECRPEIIVESVLALREGPEREAVRQACGELRRLLAPGEVSTRVAELALSMAAERPTGKTVHGE